MKKFLLYVVLALGLFSFSSNTVMAFNPGCAAGGPYNTNNGRPCTAEDIGTRCPQGDVYSVVTGKHCDAWETRSAPRINTPLIFKTKGALPSVALGESYSADIVATGGTGTYVWSVLSGNLPPGLTLNQIQDVCIKAPCDIYPNATISGKPTRSGVYSFILKVVSGLQQATRPLSITVKTY